jgi:hypothetical protein
LSGQWGPLYTAVTGLVAILAQNGVLGEKSKNFISGQSSEVTKVNEQLDPIASTKKQEVETGISEPRLTHKLFTGAIVSLSDGSVIKLRDNIREYCGGDAVLRTVHGQTIKMDLIRRFDVIDWSNQKGTVKISLNNGQVFSATISACYIEGRNDLGDFRGDFNGIRSVEFVR